MSRKQSNEEWLAERLRKPSQPVDPPAAKERRRISLVLGNVEYRLTLDELRAALATSGVVVELDCPEHGRSC